MITSAAETRLVSILPSDPANLWVRDLRNGELRTYQVSRAERLTVYGGTEDHFALVHHYGNGKIDITAHTFDKVPEVVSALHMDAMGQRFEGPQEVWKHLPIAYLFAGRNRYNTLETQVLVVDASRRHATAYTFPSEADLLLGDTGSMEGVAEANGGPLLISTDKGGVYLVNPFRWKAMQTVVEKGTATCACAVSYRHKESEFWVADANRIIRLRKRMLRPWSPVGELPISAGSSGEKLQRVAISFSASGNMAVVIRPDRQEAIVVDCTTFAVARRLAWRGAEQATTVLNSGRIVGREPATGELLEA
ncbi:MAG: hypothetical protein ACR2IE_13390 [Candidatus Sumerlaeaceae bacterium]